MKEIRPIYIESALAEELLDRLQVVWNSIKHLKNATSMCVSMHGNANHLNATFHGKDEFGLMITLSVQDGNRKMLLGSAGEVDNLTLDISHTHNASFDILLRSICSTFVRQRMEHMGLVMEDVDKKEVLGPKYWEGKDIVGYLKRWGWEVDVARNGLVHDKTGSFMPAEPILSVFGSPEEDAERLHNEHIVEKGCSPVAEKFTGELYLHGRYHDAASLKDSLQTAANLMDSTDARYRVLEALDKQRQVLSLLRDALFSGRTQEDPCP
jgi:hypothetical protein